MKPAPREPRRRKTSIAEPWHLRKDLSALLSVMLDISSELDLDELLNKVMAHATDLCDAEAGMVILTDESGNVVRRYPYRTPDNITKAEIPRNKGAIYKAIDKRKSVIINDYQSFPERIEEFAQAGVKAVMATPIIRKGDVAGVMEVFNLTPGKHFNRYHAGLLEAVSAQTSVALENAVLYRMQKKTQQAISEALRAENILLEASSVIGSTLDLNTVLNRLSELIADITGLKRNVIFLYDPRSNTHEVVAEHNGGIKVGTRYSPDEFGTEFFEMYRTEKEVVIDRDDPGLSIAASKTMDRLDAKRGLFVPIAVGGNVIGSIGMDNPGEKHRFERREIELASGLAKQAAVAIENARLYESLKESSEELQRRSKDLRALLSVALDITQGLRIDDLMYKIARNATELTGADAGAVGLFDEERGAVTYPFIYNLPEVIAKVDVPLKGSMTGLVVAQKKPMVIEDYQTFPQHLAVFAEAGLRAMAMVPLLLRGKIIGTIWVSSTNPDKRFDNRDVTILEGIGRQAAIALENARLFEDAQRKTESLAKLFEISQTISAGLELDEVFKRTVSTIKNLFDASAAWLITYDEESDLVKVAEYEGPHREEMIERVTSRQYSGLDGYAIAQKRPQIATDVIVDSRIMDKSEALKIGARSIMSIPITIKDKSIGSIGIGTRVPAQPPKAKAQLEFLETIATTVAIAIENARLYESVKESEEESRRRAKELLILNNLSNVLSQTLELDTVLNTAIDSVMELLEGDGAAIYLLDEDRGVLRLAVHRGLSDHFIKNSLEIPVGERLPGEVAKSGEPVIIENLAEHPGFEAVVVYEAFKSLVGAPIKSKGKVIGSFPLGSRQPGKFSQRDATLLESIGNEMGIAIENSRLYEAQRNISTSLQRSMLPPYVPSIPGMEIGVRYSSATEEAEVGGDFYDVYGIDGKYAMIIGDVSGKGIEAASSTSMMKYVLRSYLYQNPSPAYAITEANKFINRQEERAVFITVFCSVYDPEAGTLTFVNAGHPYPCLLDQIKKTCTVLTTFDPAIGIFDAYDFTEGTVTMNPGNLLVSYTDGVIEARSDGEFFGEERLVDTLLRVLDLPAQQIANSIIDETLKFSHGRLNDDIALLVLRRIS